MSACCNLRLKKNRHIHTMLWNVYFESFCSSKINCVISSPAIFLSRADSGAATLQRGQGDYQLEGAVCGGAAEGAATSAVHTPRRGPAPSKAPSVEKPPLRQRVVATMRTVTQKRHLRKTLCYLFNVSNSGSPGSLFKSPTNQVVPK